MRERARDGESGAALVEFAVVFPAQLFVTLAIMQLALLIVGHVLVQHAAFAAARAALVQDVPPPGSGQSSSNGQVTARMQNAANHAAAVILEPIAPTDQDLASESLGSTPTDLQWPNQNGTIKLTNQRGAYGLAQVTIDPPAVASSDYCSAEVKFEFPLVIPVVNAFFAKAGPYLLYGVPSGLPIHGYGVWPTLPITKTAVLPRPWSRQ